MDDLMDFIPSGWGRDLIHMVGCFYASQIAPLNSREWDNDWDKFIHAMDERKNNGWLDIKELTPLRYMPYVATSKRPPATMCKGLACIPNGLGPRATTIGR